MQYVSAVTTSIMQLLSREGPPVTGDGPVVKAVIVSQSFKDQRSVFVSYCNYNKYNLAALKRTRIYYLTALEVRSPT